MSNNQFLAAFFAFCFVLILRFFSLWFYKRRVTKDRKNTDFRKAKPLLSGRPIWPYLAYLSGLIISCWGIFYFIDKDTKLENPIITKGSIFTVIIILIIVEVYFLNKRLQPMYDRLRAIGKGEVTK